MLLKQCFFLLLVFIVSCSSETPQNTPSKTPIVPNYKKVTYKNDYQIGHYSSDQQAYSTNSYWIEGPGGVVLIDTQFLPSATNEMLDIVQSVTGKKVVLAIVTHASASKFNGVEMLVKRGIKVVSSKQVVEDIPAVFEKNHVLYHKQNKADYPQALTLPEVAWDKTQEIDVAGLRLKIFVVREGVNRSHVLVHFDKHLFAGDLFVNRYHSNLVEGKSKHWLERLQEIYKFINPAVIHPGRGHAMSGADLLAQQEQYLQFVRRKVAEFYTGGKITALDEKDIVQAIKEKFPEYKQGEILAPGVRAEWDSLRQYDHEMM